jgi:TPR repeat protein
MGFLIFLRYRIAADQDYATAQNNLGSLYHSGLGVEQNYSQAVEWYTRSSQLGNASAMNNLGICFEEGSRPLTLVFIKYRERSAARN